MAFLCPSRRGRLKKKKHKETKAPFLGRLTGSASVDTLVRVGLEKQHGFSPDSKMAVTQDFLATGPGELTAQTGDCVYMLYREHDWVYVITQLGQEGFLPAMCLALGQDAVESSGNKPKSDDKNAFSSDNRSVSDMRIAGEEDSSGVLQSSPMFSSTVPNPLPKPARTLINVPDLVSTETHIHNMGHHKPPSPHESGKQYSRSRRGSNKSVNSDSVTEVKTYIKEPCGKYLVVFEFCVEDENDVRVDKGEVITALNMDDPQWTWVKKLSGQEGFVPASFLCPLPLDLTTNTSNGDLCKHPNSETNKLPSPGRGPPTYHDVRELVTLRSFIAQSADDICVSAGDHVFADLANQIEKEWLWVYAPMTGNYGYIPRDNINWSGSNSNVLKGHNTKPA